MNKSHFFIVIEDTEENKFGCYIEGAVYNTNQYVNDSNAFVFSLQSNGRLDGMNRFLVKDYNHAMFLYSSTNHWLLSVGSDGGKGGKDDITIMKKDCQNLNPGNGCQQSSYNYNGIKNALCGSDSFDVKQFLVITTI